MIKKLLIGAVAAVALGTFAFGYDLTSYVRTSCKSARNAIKAEVPIEFELQRARDMVSNLMPDIRKCMHVIAEEEVGIEHLQQEVAKADALLEKQKRDLLAINADLKSGRANFQYAGRSYSVHDVKQDASRRFERLRMAEETLDSKRKVLAAREQSVHAAREKLDGMLASKRDLELQIENLSARVATMQAMQTASSVQLDDSQLARAKALIADLNRQLDVSQRVMDAEGKFADLIPVEEKSVSTEDLSAQIDEYFQKQGAPADAGDKVAETGPQG